MASANIGVDRAFPTTRWSLVARAGGSDLEIKQRALGELLRQYMVPMQIHLVKIKRIDEHQAEDLLQGFIASKLLEGNILQFANESRGKFRSFLLTALDRFVIDEARQAGAQKRSAGNLAPLEAAAGKVDQAGPPSAVFDAHWAREVLDQALKMMHEECRVMDRMDIWTVFEARVVRPALEDAKPVPYEELVDRCGFESPSKASDGLITAKRMFARNLRVVVGEYTFDENETDTEILFLRRILSERGA